MPNAVIYTRFSPRRNAEDSMSIETQLDLCRKHCIAKEWTIADEFEDRAMSGADEDRPGLWKAVGALKRGWYLVVYKLDRLSRDVYLNEYIRRALNKCGATLETVTGEGNGQSPHDVMVQQVLSAFAEYERKIIAIRTKAAMLHHQANGRRMSDKPPYGWTRDPNNPSLLIEEPDEQVMIDLIMQKRSEGKSYRHICRELAVSRLRCRGGRWHHGTVARIIRRAETA